MSSQELPEHARESTTTDDRRDGARRKIRAVVRLDLPATRLVGSAENISRSGILFFTDEPLRVRLEIEQHGETRVVEGRLVRGQRMRDDHFGWAVEFDHE
jgi:hypothetical protein